MTQTATAGPSSRAREFGKVAFVATVGIWPPLIAGRLILGPTAITMLLFGTLVGFLNTAAAGRRLGAAATIAFVLVAPVALVAGQDPVAGTCLMALGCLAVGTSAYWQRFSAFNVGLTGTLFILASPAAQADLLDGGRAQSEYLLAVLLGTLLCGLWPVAILPLMHFVKDIPLEAHHKKADTFRYVVSVTILVSATTFYALAFARDSNGLWLPLTLLMVLQVAPDTTRHRAFQRVYGTIAGALASAVLATVFHGTWVIAVVAVIAFFGLLATMGHQPYSVYAFFLTVLVLLGVSATEPPLEASLQRIVYTVIGCALALTAYLIERRLTADDTRAA